MFCQPLFYKSTTDQKPSFNKDKEFVVTRRFVNYTGTELHKMQEVNSGRKLEGKFLRKEFFTLESNAD